MKSKPLANIVLILALVFLIYSQREAFFERLALKVRQVKESSPAQVSLKAEVSSRRSNNLVPVDSVLQLPKEVHVARESIHATALNSLLSERDTTRLKVPMSENEWVSLLLAAAISGYGYDSAAGEDEQQQSQKLFACLLAVAEKVVTDVPTYDAREAIQRFHDLIGSLRYLGEVSADNKQALGLVSPDDFYRALIIGYKIGKTDLLRHGLRHPAGDVQDHVREVERRMVIWQTRLLQGDFLTPEKIQTYHQMYTRYRP